MTRTHEIESLLEHAGWLRRLAARLVLDRDGADDLVQEAWIAALRAPRPAGAPRAWLARVVRNLASNRRRDERLRRQHERAVESGGGGEDPLALAADAEAQRVLAEAVTRLPEPLRAAVVLRWYHGLDSADIARRLGVPASTVRSRLAKALGDLRAELDRRHGGERGAWSAALGAFARRSGELAAPVGLAGGAGLVAAALAAGVLAVGVASAVGWGADPGPEEPSGAHATAASGAAELVPEELQATRPVARVAVAPPAPAAAASPAAPAPAPEVELSGRILVDGRAPEWPIELELRPLDPGAPRSEWNALVRGRLQRLTTAPAEGGAFRFGAYPAAWRGRIGAQHHAIEGSDDGGNTLALAGPSSDLVLHLRSSSALFGRLVDDAGEPLRGARFAYELSEGAEAADVKQISTRVDETLADGRFRIPLSSHYRAASATLLVELDGGGHRLLETPWFASAPGHDAGDVVVEPVRPLAFRVVDAAGEPVAGAFARVEGPYWACRSVETDASGLGRIGWVPARSATVRMSAAGHADRLVEVEPGVEHVDVVLERLAVLVVQLTGSPEALDRVETLVVTAEGPLYAWTSPDWDGGPAEMQVELGATQPGVRRGEPCFQAEYGARAEGRYVVAGVAPGVPLELEVRDDDGRVLAARGTMLAPHECQTLEVPLE